MGLFFKRKPNKIEKINGKLNERQNEIYAILNRAAKFDKKLQLFGASRHKYKLNKPIDAQDVHNIEQKYCFTLPEDYFKFITEVGDGGAGLDYGINSFTELFKKGIDERVEMYIEDTRIALSKTFNPRPMNINDVYKYAICRIEAYEEKPDKYFVYDIDDNDNDLIWENGFFVLGTHGCQWDFGIVVTGERRGQIFSTDNCGGFCFLANSFDEFYQLWLNKISNIETCTKRYLGKSGIFKID